jgi:hypothetical protein
MTEPLMRSNAETPLGAACRTCSAPAGEPCTTVAKPTSEYVRVLHYFHRTRWHDYYQAHAERAALDDWNQKYGGKTA